MSILIKGIDMPKYESLTIKIMPSGAVCDQYGRLDERVKAVEEAEPTICPSEIVHCKDCRWWGSPDVCFHWEGMVTATANGFCSYGERNEHG